MKPIALNIFRDPAFIECGGESPLLTHLIRPHFAGPNERLVVFVFDDLTRLIGFVESGANHRHHALIPPCALRRIFSFAEATSLILVHNHPSGEACPSANDLELTRRIADAAGLAGLVVWDHLILIDDGHFSFRAAGLL